MMRAARVFLAAAMLGAWQQPADPRGQVRALADAGKLDEAERQTAALRDQLKGILAEALLR